MASVAVDRRPGNLPAEVTRFIGRRRELAEVKTSLERSRLVTLCGVGGVGKTRLALRTAAELQRAFADGVWLVELSALREPELLARTVAEALRLPDRSAGGDPVDLLADQLADRQLLLILDTCEHLVDACALLSEVLLRAAPRLRIVATSREPLDIMGEHVLAIPPLDAPGPGTGSGPAADCDSVTLFADRAEATAPGFTLTADNRAAVALLCHRLDGIPLAIELAAVRLRAMTIEQIAARLDDRFRLLGTSRAGRSRHQTLRATLEWSHELCTPAERLLWARLAVFPGTFDLEAAEQVCSGGDLDTESLFEVMGRLVEKSIVIREPHDGRFHMLDTLREYGVERLAAQHEAQELRHRHRDHYLALAEQAAGLMMTADQARSLDRLARDNDNLRVALDYSLATSGEETTGLRLTSFLTQYWICRGMFSEARGWLNRALACTSGQLLERGWAQVNVATFTVLGGVQEGVDKLLGEGAAIAGRSGDRALQTWVVHNRGLIAAQIGDYDQARQLLEQVRAAYQEIGFRDPPALSLFPQLTGVYLAVGEVDLAAEAAEEGLRISDGLGEQWSRMYCVIGRAMIRRFTRHSEEAIEDGRAALRTAQTLHDAQGVAMALDILAVCQADQGEHALAARLLGATDALWHGLHMPQPHGAAYGLLAALIERKAGGGLGAERFATARRTGAQLPLATVLELALGREASPAAAIDPLTKREREIAELVSEGLSNREIAERLVIAKRTVDSHVEHILGKLGFTSRTQIAAWSAGRR